MIESRQMAKLIFSHHQMIWFLSKPLQDRPIGLKTFLEEIG